MTNLRPPQNFTRLDQKEFDLPETVFVHDIDNQVIQNICSKILEQIPGVHLCQDNFIDSLLGKRGSPSLKSIHVEQDPKTKTVKIRIELTLDYGVCIPEISQSIYSEISKELPALTGLPLSQIHLLYKNISSPSPREESALYTLREKESSSSEYTDAF